jgi:putative transposase
VSVQFGDNPWFRVLTLVDQFTRKCLLLYAERALSGERIISELERLVKERGVSTSITVDNGSELASRTMDACAFFGPGIRVEFICPGKPVENGCIESFNSRLRDECLNVSLFSTLEDARQKLEQWRQDYNRTIPTASTCSIVFELTLGGRPSCAW